MQNMVFTENIDLETDSCKQELPGFDPKYSNIVDYILTITENIWEKRAVWEIYDTYSEDIPIHSGAGTTFGINSVVNGTIKTLSSFPDRKMNGEAVIWSKVEKNHFYSSHRIASTATNLGDTDFGKATGKKVFFRTIADCVVSENKIVEEWLVRDNLSIIQQLGFDPVEMAKKDLRYQNGLSNFSRNGKVMIEHSETPYIKGSNDATDLILDLFEKVWITKNFQILDDYYTELSQINCICDETLLGSRQLSEYLTKLFGCFQDAKVYLERVSCNKKSDFYEVAARWKIVGTHNGEGFFGQPSGKEVIIPGISHFVVKDNKINEEWMIFDAFDALCQIHANEGIKKVSNQSSKDNLLLAHKELVRNFLRESNQAETELHTLSNVLKKYLSVDVKLSITKPFNPIEGISGYQDSFLVPLAEAFPDLECQPYILMGGQYEGEDFVSATGNYIGTFKKDWLGIPHTNQCTWLRFGAHFQIKNNKIHKAWFFFDVLDILRQAGYNFIPQKGTPGVPPAPMTGDGILVYPIKSAESQKSIDLTNAMLDGLLCYDGKSLDSMGQERFWNVKNMMWYGPSGIGTTRGLKGFQDNHQVPFLTAFPDRGIIERSKQECACQYGDGNYSCDFGFPAMYGTHNGDGWLGLKATNKKITLRVMDFWRREGNKLIENWVFIDIVDAFEQLGVDIFEMLEKEKIRNTKV